MTEKRKSVKKAMPKTDSNQFVDEKKNEEGILADVLKYVTLLTDKDPKMQGVADLKRGMMLLMEKGEKVSPFVKRFILKNLPDYLLQSSLIDADRQKKILEFMYLQALKDETLLHVDFVEYQRKLAQKFSDADKNFFLNLCSITERVISSDSKKTLFLSPDERIRAVESEMLVQIPEGIKNAVKKNLFTFKRERIHLSRGQKDYRENYCLLKRMCQKYYQDISRISKKMPEKKLKSDMKNMRVKS